MNVLKLIASSSFIAVNKVIARAVGLYEAVVLGAMCSELTYCESRGKLTEDGFFPFSVNALQEETTLGEKPQKVAINNLIACGILEQTFRNATAERTITTSPSSAETQIGKRSCPS